MPHGDPVPEPVLVAGMGNNGLLTRGKPLAVTYEPAAQLDQKGIESGRTAGQGEAGKGGHDVRSFREEGSGNWPWMMGKVLRWICTALASGEASPSGRYFSNSSRA